MSSCGICGEEFGNKAWVTKHKKAEHDYSPVVNLTCDECGDEFEKYRSKYNENSSHYCSDSCKNEGMKGDGEYRNCDWCGDEKWVQESMLEEMGDYPLDNTFCDKDCESKFKSANWVGEEHPSWNGGKVQLECEECGDAYFAKSSEVGKSSFCSRDCFYESNAVDEEKYECVNCGDVVQKKPYNVKGENVVCKDRECYIEYMRSIRKGDENPSWNSGNPDNYGSNWNEKRREILERDEFSCNVCGMSRDEHYSEYDKDLHVHHKIPIATFDEPEDANYLTNLITSCQGCHPKLDVISRNHRERRLEVAAS